MVNDRSNLWDTFLFINTVTHLQTQRIWNEINVFIHKEIQIQIDLIHNDASSQLRHIPFLRS
jgi:hypothetical protein